MNSGVPARNRRAMRKRVRRFGLLSLVSLLVMMGCGDDTAPVDASVDGSFASDVVVDSGVDASVQDSGQPDSVSTDAGAGDPTCLDGPNGFDARPAACSERAECFDDPGCIAALFGVNDREGYAPCSESIPFSSADSAAVCELPLQGFEEDIPETRCAEEEYSGEVTFYCAEGQDVVLMVHDMEAPSDYLGYYLWAGSGFASMSGYGVDGRIEQAGAPGRIRSIGYTSINTGSGGIGPSFTAIAHFTSGLNPGPEYITGGFEVEFEGEGEE